MPKKNEYVKLWLSYESYFEPYSDVEVGRLVRAMMEYRASREEPEFNGNERYVWPAIRRDIDEAIKAQEESAETSRRNGENGGRPRGQSKPDGFSESQENQSGFSETQKTTRTKDKDKDKGQGQGQLEAIASCAEPETVSTQPVIVLPLNDGTDYSVSKEQCQEWAGLYPAVDVIQQLRNMKGWLNGNPTKRKTKRGIARFITGWLSREQDRGRGPSRAPQSGSGNVFMDMLRQEGGNGT